MKQQLYPAGYSAWFKPENQPKEINVEEQAKYEIKVTDKRVGNNPDSFDPSGNYPAQASPNAVIMMAMQKGYTPELIEKMMALNERYEANEARKAYYQAVSDFKRNPPQILKDKENSQFSRADKKSMYVSLGNLVQTVNPALGAHGLSASWEINQAEKMVKVSCKLSHALGHSETVTMEAPPDTSGGNAKNPIQQIKSTVTYLRAATFEAVTGLAASDDATVDDDGNGAGGVEYIDEKQLSQITEMINSKGVDKKAFLTYMKAEATDKIIAKDFNKAITALKKAKGRQPGEEG